MSELLRRLAAKAHDHQLVPFLGAGCALGHVQVDWDGITRVMAERLPGVDGPRSNPEAADLFVNSDESHTQTALEATMRTLTDVETAELEMATDEALGRLDPEAT